MNNWKRVRGTVVEGHGVASGVGDDPRFPAGTLVLQRPFFKKHGIDLTQYYPATLNVSIAPSQYALKEPKYTLRDIEWTDEFPPEDFSFVDCRVIHSSGDPHEGLIYYPHPDTKPDHFQSPGVLEIITTFMPEVTYGDEVVIEYPPQQLTVEKRG